MSAVKLSMFARGGYSVIAVDEADATHELNLQLGGESDDIDEDVPGSWVRCDQSEMLTIWCDENLVVDEPDGDGAWPVTMSVAQWIKHHGRGFLCSEDV